MRILGMRMASASLLGMVLSGFASGAEQEPKPASAAKAESKPLFDGRTLDGWVVTECKVEVKDGTILLASGNGLARTDRKYADYVLELDWKALKSDDSDSGIFIRFDLPLPKGRAWPKEHQINLKKGQEGNTATLKGATSTGLVKPGEWNHFKLTVIGTTAALDINGKPAWKANGLKPATGYIGLQAEVPLGGQFQFRDVRIVELTPAAAKK